MQFGGNAGDPSVDELHSPDLFAVRNSDNFLYREDKLEFKLYLQHQKLQLLVLFPSRYLIRKAFNVLESFLQSVGIDRV